jgi:flagellar biosynthetic protein FliR
MDVLAFARFGVLLVRPGMLVIVAAPFGGSYGTAYTKVGLTVMLAFMMAPVAPVPETLGPMGFSMTLAREAAIGLALAFGVRVLIGAAELAGYLAGFQIGFSYASVADPQTGVRNNIMSSLYGLVAVLVIFGTNTHHDILRALAQSYHALPIGAGGLDGSLAGVVARMLGLIFLVGTQIAAPILLVLLIAELALGLMSRAAPSLNLLSLGYPVRLVLGLLTIALTFRAIPLAIEHGIPAMLRMSAQLAEVFR